jgi:hypothetical protein
MQNGIKNPNDALAGSNDFMHMFGHVCLGFMWAKMAKAAQEQLKNEVTDREFYLNKLTTGLYYMERQLPATGLHLERITSGSDIIMKLEANAF